MNTNTRESRFEHVNRVLSEMPWLWAVRSGWGSQPIDFIQPTSPADLDTELPFSYHSATCYIHFVSDKGRIQRVDKIELEVTNTNQMPTLYDVLVQVKAKGKLLCYVEHMVAVVGDTVKVYRTKYGSTFEKLFDQHPRSSRG